MRRALWVLASVSSPHFPLVPRWTWLPLVHRSSGTWGGVGLGPRGALSLHFWVFYQDTLRFREDEERSCGAVGHL